MLDNRVALSGAALNTSNQRSKFRTKNWVEINDESRGGYTTGSDIKSKTTILKSSSCGYADAYILVKGTITITGLEQEMMLLEDEQMKETKVQYLKIAHYLPNS